MATEIRFVDNTLGKRFEEIAATARTIKYAEHAVSTTPVQSKDYGNCCGVVLLGAERIGISHYDLLAGSPEEYLTDLIEKVQIPRVAVLVGGDTGHMQRNRDIITSFHIPIIGEYCDNWMDEGVMPRAWNGKAPKHIVALPAKQEVLMYSQPVGYRILTS